MTVSEKRWTIWALLMAAAVGIILGILTAPYAWVPFP